MSKAKIERFQVFTRFLDFVDLARDLEEARKVSNFYLQASKLVIWLMKGYSISSILKIKMKQFLGSLDALALGLHLRSQQSSAVFAIFPWAWCLTEAVKVLNLYLQAGKLDICSMKGYPVSSILKNENETAFRVSKKPLLQVPIWDLSSVRPFSWFFPMQSEGL